MQSWLDRLTMPFAPRWTLKRVRARVAAEVLVRHYEAATAGRRTQGWHRGSTDPNAALFGSTGPLRDHTRDLVRNNPHAAAALATIVDHTVGWGITATPKKGAGPKAALNVARDRWAAWAGTTACDAEGRQDFYGLTRQVDRTVVEAGECLVRRRIRRPSDNLPLPFQLQVLEPDYLDSSKEGMTDGGRIIQGVEFDAIGRRVAYWLYREHPGAQMVALSSFGFGASQRVPASEILHIYRPERAGQVRGVPWFAPVILKLKDVDEYDDATILKAKIAACLAVITSDVDGTAPALGEKADGKTPGELDLIEPGMILNVPPGRSVTTLQPPSVNEHEPFMSVSLRQIAAGLGVTYEDLTGDYAGLPFSAARMSRLRHWARVHGWRWHMLIPQFCDPVWTWAMQAAAIMNLLAETPPAEWTAPPMPLLDPDKEGTALSRLVRNGALTWPEMVRERGFDPDAVLAEIQEWNAKFDAAGVVLDCDPRKVSQQGQPSQKPESAPGRPGTEDEDDPPERAARNGQHAGGHG